MVNIDQNEEFNRLIQDINKMVFLKMNGSWRSSDFYATVTALQTDEDMEEYVIIDGPDAKLYLLGKRKTDRNCRTRHDGKRILHL